MLNFSYASTDEPSNGLVKIIKTFELFEEEPSGEPFQRIGYGHAIMSHEKHLMNKKLTKTQAVELLIYDIKRRANINFLIKIPLEKNEFEALRSLCFSIGLGNFKESELLKRLNNSNVDKTDVYEYFSCWRKERDVISCSLIKRRFVELFIFAGRSLNPDDFSCPSAQWNSSPMPITDENWQMLDYHSRVEAVSLFDTYHRMQ